MGRDEQRMYMVTELASGGSLEEMIEQGNHIRRLMKTKAATPGMKMPFDGIQTTCWALQIAAGMAHIHDCNFLHRDLKPQNVLLNGEGARAPWAALENAEEASAEIGPMVSTRSTKWTQY